MPLFVCDLCQCVENTALGHYWGRDQDYFGKPELVGKALCSECSPDTYKDGSKNSDGGRWHGKFPKRKVTPEDLKGGGFMDRNGNLMRGK
jgi:hypothetical protein